MAPKIVKIVRKPVKTDDDIFARLTKQEEPEPDDSEKPNPLAKYGVPPFEEWDPPF